MKSDDVRHREWRKGRGGPVRLIAGLVLAVNFLFLAIPAASAETRTLRLYFVHTKERAEITYKRNGRYLQSGLKEVSRFLRDWRRNEPTNMDPRLLDTLWEVYRASGSRDYIHVVSAYRSPQTNAMLRSRSKGVAEKSQHMLGKAVDFYIPDVKLSRLRDIGLRMQAGGVGYYPRSGSPFVHLDVGGVRHWPRMSRQQLAAVFPDGKTLHVPSDGKPLPGYEQALASYQSRQRNGGSIQIADDSAGNRGRGLLARIFGGGADEEEDNANAEIVVAQRPARSVDTAPQQPQQTPTQAQQPQTQQPQAEETPELIIASLPSRAIPLPRVAPRPVAEIEAVQPAAEAAPVQDPQSTADALLTALSVPVPTRRPSYTSPEATVAVAQVEEEADEAPPAAVAYATPTRRPERLPTSDVIAELLSDEKENAPAPETVALAAIPVPGSRPEEISGDEGETVLASATPEIALPLALASTESAAAKAEDLAVAAVASEYGAAKRARPGAAGQKMALLERENGISPAAFISGGARTAPKSARPRPGDVRPEPAPMIVPVEAISARLVLSGESVLNKKPESKVPAFNMGLAEAPKAVYTDGFQQAPVVADARRFTGKAVTFLSLAKFDSN